MSGGGEEKGGTGGGEGGTCVCLSSEQFSHAKCVFSSSHMSGVSVTRPRTLANAAVVYSCCFQLVNSCC